MRTAYGCFVALALSSVACDQPRCDAGACRDAPGGGRTSDEDAPRDGFADARDAGDADDLPGDGGDDGPPDERLGCTRSDECGSPPESACVGATLRVFAPFGTCAESACVYASIDYPCADGCSGGECVGACSPGRWRAETAAVTGSAVESNMLVGPDDRLYMVFGGFPEGATAIVAARGDDGGSWPTSLVAAGSGLAYPTLGIDAAGVQHVTWEDIESGIVGTLMHSSRAPGGTWSRPMEIADVSVQAHANALAVDPAGAAHVVYIWRSSTRYMLRYGMREPGATRWSHGLVESGAFFTSVSLALDSMGGVHTAYIDERLGDRGADPVLRYAVSVDGGAWIKRDVPVSLAPRVSSVQHAAIAVTASGEVHIVAVSVDGLQHLVLRPSGDWIATPVGAAGAEQPSVAVDAAGLVHIAYRSRYDGLGYAVGRDGSFADVLLDPGVYPGNRSSIAVDSAGGVHIAYESGGDVRYLAYDCR
jgi:hypothetical protein